MTDQKQQPLEVVQRGNIQAAIWENTSQNGKAFHAVTLERSYKGSDGEWTKSRISLFSDEALKMASALTKVYELSCELGEMKARPQGRSRG